LAEAGDLDKDVRKSRQIRQSCAVLVLGTSGEVFEHNAQPRQRARDLFNECRIGPRTVTAHRETQSLGGAPDRQRVAARRANAAPQPYAHGAFTRRTLERSGRRAENGVEVDHTGQAVGVVVYAGALIAVVVLAGDLDQDGTLHAVS